MKAILIRKYGKSDVLEYVTIPKPNIRDHEILVKIRASSVNPIDWKLRYGVLKVLTKHKLPLVLGCDVAGEVVKVGKKVKQFAVGDAIFAQIDALTSGAYAEYAAIPAHTVAHKPTNFNFEQAAAIPLAALTALQALRDKGKIRPKMKILVNGGSGGVGHFGIQIAKAFDTYVTAVCSTRNIEMVKNLGADHIIDYTQQDFTKNNSLFNIVFDTIGNKSLKKCSQILTSNGVYITTLPGPKEFVNSWQTIFSKQKSKVVIVKPNGADMRFLKKLAETDQLKPVIDQVFPLSAVAAAHEYNETERTRGKIVIKI